MAKAYGITADVTDEEIAGRVAVNVTAKGWSATQAETPHVCAYTHTHTHTHTDRHRHTMLGHRWVVSSAGKAVNGYCECLFCCGLRAVQLAHHALSQVSSALAPAGQVLYGVGRQEE